MKVLIVGCGRVGALLARSLDAEGHEVTILDNDDYSFRRLKFSLDLPDFRGTALRGNGIDEEALKRAGIETTDVFFALTQGDNRNVMACQIAKHIFNVPRTICRIYDPLRQELYNTLGIEAISPTAIISNILEEMMES
ncbi:MAG: TrkA family potassium uptake protein [Dehalococcoidales bacterium]|nr:MAG: TrkA family potassium uptake protein [Dehalococcoidales bacterium]